MSDQERAPKKAKTESSNEDNDVEGGAGPTTANAGASESNIIINQRRQKESLILQELSTALHTIQNISNVLDDIVHLTTLPPATETSDNSDEDVNDIPHHRNNVMLKQQRLLNELQQWKQLVPSKK